MKPTTFKLISSLIILSVIATVMLSSAACQTSDSGRITETIASTIAIPENGMALVKDGDSLKSVYEPGETITVTATIRNSSSIASGVFDMLLRSNRLGNLNLVSWSSMPASSSYHSWQEYRLESGNYVLKNYWMRLTTTFTMVPDPRVAIAGRPDVIESGFGLTAMAATTFTTNYDRTEKLVGPQMLYAFYPETFYGLSPYARYADALAVSSGNPSETSITWQYPVSPFSTVGSRLHFTPLWIPDGSYPILAQAFYAWSPVGQVYEYKSDPVTILGDMYDRVTVVRR